MTDLSAYDAARQGPLPGPGDNLGEPIDDGFDALKARTDAIAETGNKWITERPEIADEEQAQAATVFIKQVNAHKKEVEIERKARNAPHRDAIKTTDDVFKVLLRPIEIAKEHVTKVLTIWQRKQDEARQEAQRAADAEAIRRQEEAEAAARAAETETKDAIGARLRAEQAEADAKAAAKVAARAAEPVRTRSDSGQTASLRRNLVAKITDAAAIPATVVWPYIVAHDQPAIERALRRYIADLSDAEKKAFADGSREIAGVTIREETTSVIR